ncbi:MAG: DMT family transporter [Pseudomonadota bacterium]
MNSNFELLLPVGLALLAAVLFAFGNQCSRIAMQYTDSQTASLFQIGVSTALYWLIAPFYLEISFWSSPVLPLLAAIGLIRPLLSANLGMAGTRILGPTISSTLAATAPLFGVALGVVLLSEILSWEVALGTAGIVFAVVILSWQRDSGRTWPMIALLLPIGAAMIRSLAHALAKIGLEVLPNPFFVALVAYTVALPIALANDLRIRQHNPRRLSTAGLKWLVITGLIYAVSVLVMNTALMSGRLIVVSPIVACSPLFTLLLGRFVFREESLNRKVAVAVLLVVPSVMLIGLRA